MSSIRAAQAAWDEAEPPLLAFLLKVLLTVGLTVASPFFALAFLFVLLEKPLSWILVSASLGAVVVSLALAGWLVVRSRLRGLRRHLDRAAAIETAIGDDRLP